MVWISSSSFKLWFFDFHPYSVLNNYNLCICVGLFRRLISITEINDKKETWKIVVQVINMWTIPRSPKCIVELILVDKKVRLTDFY